MFGSSNRGQAGRQEPIVRRHERHLQEIPNLESLANEAIGRAGLQGLLYGSPQHQELFIQTLNAILGRMEQIGVDYLERHVSRKAARGMVQLKERSDFYPRMLLDYLSMQGPAGIAIHNKIADYINDPQFVADLSEVIREQR